MRRRGIRLQDHAALATLSALAALPLAVGEGCTCRVLKDLPDALACLCRALDVLDGADSLLHFLALLHGDWLLGSLVQLLNGLGVESQILLAAYKDNREPGAEVQDFGDPLLLNIVERIGRVDGETDEDDMRVWVGEGSESIVILLASRIPQS